MVFWVSFSVSEYRCPVGFPQIVSHVQVLLNTEAIYKTGNSPFPKYFGWVWKASNKVHTLRNTYEQGKSNAEMSPIRVYFRAHFTCFRAFRRVSLAFLHSEKLYWTGLIAIRILLRQYEFYLPAPGLFLGCQLPLLAAKSFIGQV